MGKKFKLKPKKSLKFLSIKFFILVCPTAIFIIINILYKKKNILITNVIKFLLFLVYIDLNLV